MIIKATYSKLSGTILSLHGHGGDHGVVVKQGSHGHGKSWETMENEKIKSRPGKVMENENLAKSHGKVMEF